MEKMIDMPKDWVAVLAVLFGAAVVVPALVALCFSLAAVVAAVI